MNLALARRGPDAEGCELWPQAALGHRRLSIFDLSDLGRQPMVSPDGQTGVVFNGAIYNFHEIRADLVGAGYKFRSQTDTEVLLHGFEAWGIDRLVQRLRGMYAIGLWDNRQGKLYLIRDRLGVKPLLYAQQGNRIAFASTAAAVEASGLAGPLDRRAVAEFFEFGYVTDQRVIFERVHKVPPASILEFSPATGATSLREYWQPSVVEAGRGALPFNEVVDRTEALFLEAVKLRLEADVPVGALLSGGIDSSLVCWAISRLGGRIKAFTVGTPGDPLDESADAIATARQLGIDHAVIELAPETDLAIDDLVAAYGEPFACSSALGMLRVSLAIKPVATVLLTGDGGDDCFLGYPEHKHFYWAQRVAASTPELLASLWPRARGQRVTLPHPLRRLAHFADFAWGGLGSVARIHDGLPFYRQNGLLGERLKDTELTQRALPQSVAAGRQLLADFLAYDRGARFTGEYLTKVDGGTMFHALEARAPFLDQELWNWAHSLPFSTRLHQGELKAVLRALARRHIGDRVASGRKRGFGIPAQRWLATRWSADFQAVLADSVAAREGWISASAAGKLFEQTKGSGTVPLQLWYIYVLEKWLRRRPAGRLAR